MSARDVIIGAILVVVLLAFVIGVEIAQRSGEAPAFTCDPGGTYTIAECP